MAGLIPESFINEVRANINIVDVISQYVSLEKKGKDYSGLCPFHQEKTPSFTVNEQKQFFKCFGCGKGGNVFKFLMYKDNLTFPESVKAAADFAHIPMLETYHQENTVMSGLLSLQKDAAEFYHQVLLTTKAGQTGLKYAQQRGLNNDLIKHFQIGYAPKQDNLLLVYLRQKKYSEEDLAKSGLFIETKEGRLFDRFRDRLMFPLANESGHVIGFSGRRLSDDKTVAKYMNSPETELFTKSKVLFNFAEAKKAARKEEHLVLYEGYMDVIAAYKAGVQSGIASMGTSLTDQQVYMLKRITNNIVVNYDGDDPGQHAAQRASDLFNKVGGFNLGIVVLPEKLDPDEYIKKYGPEKYCGELKAALTPIDFFLERLEKKYNLANDREKIAYLDEAVKEIAKLSNPVEQDLYLDKVAKKQEVSLAALKVNLTKQVRKMRVANRHKNYGNSYTKEKVEPIITPNREETQNDPVQTRLIFLFIHSEHARNYLLEKKFLFPDADYAKLAELWLKFIDSHEDASINSFLDFIPAQLQGIIVNAEMINMPQDYSEREIDEQLTALQMREIDQQLIKKQREMQDAKRKADNEEIIKITQQILELKRIKG